jgi:hypothetical protein
MRAAAKATPTAALRIAVDQPPRSAATAATGVPNAKRTRGPSARLTNATGLQVSLAAHGVQIGRDVEHRTTVTRRLERIERADELLRPEERQGDRAEEGEGASDDHRTRDGAAA